MKRDEFLKKFVPFDMTDMSEAETYGQELPWPKREIIDAMIAEYQPVDLEDMGTWAFFTQVRALMRLARSEKAPMGFGVGLAERVMENGGEHVTELEDAVCARLGRVWQALRDGRDPNAAYEVPLRGR